MSVSAGKQKAQDFFDALCEKYPVTYVWREGAAASSSPRPYRSTSWEDGIFSEVQFCGIKRTKDDIDDCSYEFLYKVKVMSGDYVTVKISYNNVYTDEKGGEQWVMRLTAETEFASDHHTAESPMQRSIMDAVTWHQRCGFEVLRQA